ncbi:Putative ribonuclease III domain, double-stranded RNA-binding domain-containing protein [Septoria linicola]|uniref:Large ribosomal subunit protein mL44 n=1 Tax=Septoria linicola TaxID=215465 RepID=A0A9Q9AVH7_9PEZI|nr:Putative ribonuclease III domain, double-stranded RNA-binding domain-containing protein [Septoria linicola]
MKSLRLERWASQLQQAPRNPRLLQRTCPFSSTTRLPRRDLQTRYQQLQSQWQHNQRRTITTKRKASTSAAAEQVQQEEAIYNDDFVADGAVGVGSGIGSAGGKYPLNFPSHREAVRSAKLAALHARLSLPSKLPLQTLARCLIDPSVDPRPGYNNAPMAILGQELLGYYTTEWLICKYPRLPMSIIMAAAYGYLGNATLNSMRLEWGVEAVAAPGPEVDAGLLQLKRTTPGNAMAEDGTRRVKDVEQDESDRRHRHKSLSGRIVYDDMFGEVQDLPAFDLRPYAGAPVSQPDQASENAEMADSIGAGVQSGEIEAQVGHLPLQTINTDDMDMNTEPATIEDASAGFVRALAGAIYLHAGTDAIKEFHKAHVLSRHLPLHNMFNFKHPTQDLSKLCRREGWESPVARLISETGRLSRTPVFVVGVFSGDDKLGEGAGASLNEGRVRAAADALRSWYLYSPMDSQIVYPSEVEGSAGKRKKWIPQYVDSGEIVA